MCAVTEHPERAWTLLTNHGRVLLLISRTPTLRIRDISAAAGITERSANAIVSDLERAGLLLKSKVGRRNEYVVLRDAAFRHPAESGHTIGELVDLFADAEGPQG